MLLDELVEYGRQKSIGRLVGVRARSARPSPGLGDVEPEGGVGGEPLGVHSIEDRDAGIDVVVELDVVLAFVGSQEPSDVLDDAAFEREGEGEEQRVELGPVEAFAEVGAGCDEHDAAVGSRVDEGVADGGACLLAESAAKHVARRRRGWRARRRSRRCGRCVG